MGASGSCGGPSGSTLSGPAAVASGSGSGGVSGIGNANAGTSGIGAGVNAASLGGTGSVVEPRTPTAGVQNKQLENVKGDHPSVGGFLRFLRHDSFCRRFLADNEEFWHSGCMSFSRQVSLNITTRGEEC